MADTIGEVMIGTVQHRFEEQGNLTDEQSRKLIATLLRNLAPHARQRQEARAPSMAV